MNLINRKSARALGLKKYFTGEPCRNGHVAERYVGSATCAACIAVANGRDPSAPAADAPRPSSRADMLADLPEQRLRAYHEDVPALQRLATAFCLALHPTLTESDVRSHRGAARAGATDRTAVYYFRFPHADTPTMQTLANGYLRAHSTGEEVAKTRAGIIRQATDLALEDRPPVPEWDFK